MMGRQLSGRAGIRVGRHGERADDLAVLLLLLVVHAAQAALLPVLPLRVAAAGSWPAPAPGGRFYGDVRAVLDVAAPGPGGLVSAQVFCSTGPRVPCCVIC